MNNSTLLSKTLLAFLLARQDLPDQPILTGELPNQINADLNLLAKRSYLNDTQVGNIQRELMQFLSTHPEWQEKYEGWLEKLKAVPMTPAWSPTNAEIDQMFPAPTQSEAGLFFSDNHAEVENKVLAIASKSVPDILNGKRQTEEITWLQRIKKLILSAIGGSQRGE